MGIPANVDRRIESGAPEDVVPTAEVSSRASLASLELALVRGDWEASIRGIVQVEAEALQVERVAYWINCPVTSGMHCDVEYVATKGFLQRGAQFSSATHVAYFDAISTGSPVTIDDVNADPRAADLREHCTVRGVTSVLVVPVSREGSLVGVLDHEHVGPKRRWTVAEVQFATAAARVVARALAMRTLTPLEANARRIAFLDHVSAVVGQSLDPHEVARRAVELLVPHVADAAIVNALNREGDLECLGSHHMDAQRRELTARIGDELARQGRGDSLPWVVLREGQGVLVGAETIRATLGRYELSAELRSLLELLGSHSAMAVPLATGGVVFGAITLFAMNRRLGPEDLSLAAETAPRVAAALENARLYGMVQDAIRARDEFLGLAAHELRTPLTALALQTARSSAGAVAVSEPSIARQVRRLCALVERMLEASRIRAEGVALELEACSLRAIVEATVRSFDERARVAGCPIALAIATDHPLVGTWDRACLERVVSELLDNAIKFAGKKPLELTLDRDGPHAVLVVRDHGVGIPAVRLPAIFSPFERAAPKENFGGLGLGLFIAHAIVDAHGGSIHAKSEFGQGSTFVVRLPLEAT